MNTENAPDDVDKLILRLHEEGNSIIESIKAVRELLGVNLGEAKQLVSQNPVWHDVVEAHIPLHDELIALMEQSGGEE